MEKRKTCNNWSRVFQVALKGGEVVKTFLGEIWSFNAFVILKIRFSHHPLIKICMIYLYIRPEVKKNDTTAVTAAINEARIGGLQQNFWLGGAGGGFFWCRKWKQNFVAAGWDSPLSTEFPKKTWGKGQSNSYLVGVKSKIKVAWTFWVIWGIQGWYNSGRYFLGHCFVLRDLIPVQLNLISVSRYYETEHVHHRQNFW